MKKLLYLLLLGVALGCAKNDASLTTSKSNLRGLKLYSSLSLIKDVDTKQVAFGMFSAIEKFDLWQARFDSEIRSGKFSEPKIIAIRELASSLSPAFFKKGDQKEIFKSVTLPKWIESNSSILTKEEMNNLLFNIGDNSPNYVIADCHCAVGSSWTCYSGGGYWAPCARREKTACQVKPSGCGALWDDECDGNRCGLYYGPEL